MTKKLSLTRMLMRDPDDKPPRSPVAAAAWRKKRLADFARADAEREKYEAALAEMKLQTRG